MIAEGASASQHTLSPRRTSQQLSAVGTDRQNLCVVFLIVSKGVWIKRRNIRRWPQM